MMVDNYLSVYPCVFTKEDGAFLCDEIRTFQQAFPLPQTRLDEIRTFHLTNN